MKVLLVSDATNFALTDVYHGYEEALKQLNIPYESFPYHLFRDLIADKICYHVIHSTALLKYKEFTHIFSIGGLNIPEFLLESLYHIKSVVISTEDPHNFDPLKLKLDKIDYYFTNERSIANSGKYKNVYYCPTAGSSFHCRKFPKDLLDKKYYSDLLFLGAMYPNRQKLLEGIIPIIEEYKIDFKICGHIGFMPKKSPLWKYVTINNTIPHEETINYYNGTKAVINILRDTSWDPREADQRNRHNKGRFKAESLNPRAYEVPMCQTFQFLDESRSEAREVFSEDEVGFFTDSESLGKQIIKYLVNMSEEDREKMIFNSYKKVAFKHTYVNRLQTIIEVLNKDIR